MQKDLQKSVQKLTPMHRIMQRKKENGTDAETRAVVGTVSCADTRAVLRAELHAEIGADRRAVVGVDGFAEKFAPMQIMLWIEKKVIS